MVWADAYVRIMPLWWSVERMARSRRWIDRGRAKSMGRGKPAVETGHAIGLRPERALAGVA